MSADFRGRETLMQDAFQYRIAVSKVIAVRNRDPKARFVRPPSVSGVAPPVVARGEEYH